MAKPKYEYTDKHFLLKLEGWARDGWEDRQMAESLRLNETYFCELKTKFPEISEALKRGRQPLDIIVENSLYKRATGLKVKSIVKRWQVDTEGDKTEVEIIQETETELPPDTGAAMAWLKNRKPDEWNKQPAKVELTGKDGKDLIPIKGITFDPE